MNNNNEELLTAKEISAYLSLHLHTIYNWVYARRIPYYKVGKSLRFKKSEILEWAKKQGIAKKGGA